MRRQNRWSSDGHRGCDPSLPLLLLLLCGLHRRDRSGNGRSRLLRYRRSSPAAGLCGASSWIRPSLCISVLVGLHRRVRLVILQQMTCWRCVLVRPQLHSMCLPPQGEAMNTTSGARTSTKQTTQMSYDLSEFRKQSKTAQRQILGSYRVTWPLQRVCLQALLHLHFPRIHLGNSSCHHLSRDLAVHLTCGI
jgi:hypothetical protein